LFVAVRGIDPKMSLSSEEYINLWRRVNGDLVCSIYLISVWIAADII